MSTTPFITATISGFLSSLREAKKDNDNSYADFLFLGGKLNLSINDEHLKLLSPFVGKQIFLTVTLKPDQLKTPRGYDVTGFVLHEIQSVKNI